jgi:8-oxo-dGTP pyrophosphatase MutT (NUDIX family)
MQGYVKNLRCKIGNMPIILASVGVIIYKDKKVLLQKRSDNDLWAIHGGAVEIGETIDTALKRELMEEINIIPHKYTLYGIYSGDKMHNKYPNGDEVYYLNSIFFCEEFIGNLKEDMDEVKELKWFNIDDLPENIIEVDKTILNDLDNYLEKRQVIVK